MKDQLVAWIVDESKWLAASMVLAVLVVTVVTVRDRGRELATRHRVQTAMNLLFSVTVGNMAFGHLLAVTTKLAMGTLPGSAPPLYLLGFALATPTGWLLAHTLRSNARGEPYGAKSWALNLGSAGTLLALGVHNLPIAAPGLLNIGYQLHTRPLLGRLLVAGAALVHLGLLVGSLVFFASGQSFEEFSANG